MSRGAIYLHEEFCTVRAHDGNIFGFTLDQSMGWDVNRLLADADNTYTDPSNPSVLFSYAISTGQEGAKRAANEYRNAIDRRGALTLDEQIDAEDEVYSGVIVPFVEQQKLFLLQSMNEDLEQMLAQFDNLQA